jgi:hypothetical protein
MYILDDDLNRIILNINKYFIEVFKKYIVDSATNYYLFI